MCESIRTGNQGNHKSPAEMQRVDLFWAAGTHRHTGPLGSVYPSEKRHTGIQAPLGSVHPSTQ